MACCCIALTLMYITVMQLWLFYICRRPRLEKGLAKTWLGVGDVHSSDVFASLSASLNEPQQIIKDPELCIVLSE